MLTSVGYWSTDDACVCGPSGMYTIAIYIFNNIPVQISPTDNMLGTPKRALILQNSTCAY